MASTGGREFTWCPLLREHGRLENHRRKDPKIPIVKPNPADLLRRFDESRSVPRATAPTPAPCPRSHSHPPQSSRRSFAPGRDRARPSLQPALHQETCREPESQRRSAAGTSAAPLSRAPSNRGPARSAKLWLQARRERTDSPSCRSAVSRELSRE